MSPIIQIHKGERGWWISPIPHSEEMEVIRASYANTSSDPLPLHSWIFSTRTFKKAHQTKKCFSHFPDFSHFFPHGGLVKCLVPMMRWRNRSWIISLRRWSNDSFPSVYCIKRQSKLISTLSYGCVEAPAWSSKKRMCRACFLACLRLNCINWMRLSTKRAPPTIMITQQMMVRLTGKMTYPDRLTDSLKYTAKYDHSCTQV